MKMCSANFDFENPSEEEEAFHELRRQLLIIFKNITRLEPEVSVQYVTTRFGLLMEKGGAKGCCSPQVPHFGWCPPAAAVAVPLRLPSLLLL